MMERYMRVVAILLLLFLTITTINLTSCHGDGALCIESEKQALLSFKQDLMDPSNRLSSWDAQEKGDCCKWVGVVCNELTGHVRELRLRNPHPATLMIDDDDHQGSALGGKMSPSLLNLTRLEHLDLSQNDFGGIPIPSFVGGMTSLRYLSLSGAGFGGLVPRQLGNLSSLRFLSLQGGGSHLGVEIGVENLHWLAGLSYLESLDMSQVRLKKASPHWLQVINMLPSLVELNLSSCGLNLIPRQLDRVNFSSLAALDLSRNDFNSLLPSWIPSLSNSLVSLRLSSSGFFGLFPDGFRNLTHLKVLDASQNLLNSSLPSWLFSLNGLVSLNLNSNGFKGLIPGGNWNLTSLKSLDFSQNEFDSSLPNELFRLNGLLSLNLHQNRFEGPLPYGFLWNTTSLKDLDLSENRFNSTIPSSLYSCTLLESLNIGHNQLRGVISGDIGNMSSATILDLSYNELEGGIPRSMGNLCNLRIISLSSNKLGGQVSEMLKSLSGCVVDSLESLEIWENQLYGHFTEQLGQFRNLQQLILYSNSISGTIPVSVGGLSSLVVLDLSRNQLNGTLPKSLGRLSKLVQLYLSHNLLEGVVSEDHFANLTALKVLSASGNALALKVGPNWIPPSQLEVIYMRSWQLGPRFPSWLQSQNHISELDMSGTGISDLIPAWFWNVSFVASYVSLSHNQIHGGISRIPHAYMPEDIYIPALIYLGSNNLSGRLPRLSPDVTELDLSKNSFSGGISDFLCGAEDGPYHQLELLHLGGNLLSGEIPDCWMNWPLLLALNLENNNLNGSIPTSMGLIPYLHSLHLRNNSLNGELPLSLQNSSILLALDLAENEFVGKIPSWLWESLSNLEILSLRSNNFRGRISPRLCHLSSLQILDLAHNSLSGRIPSCINNLTAMATQRTSTARNSYSFHYGVFLENAFVVTKGGEFEYDTIVKLVTSMDLSGNNFSGEVPKELTALLGLRSLNLSGNHLSGVIPPNIGEMGLIESLDLSRNQISGEIPLSMSDLTFLSYLNLSYNNLSGVIPSSTQLQSFEASSYIGNKLCGPPLATNCSRVGATPDDDNDGEKSEVDWFYLCMVFGFVTGFWAVMGPLCFKRPWRIAYFRFLDHLWDKLYVFIRVNLNRFK